MEDKYIQVYQYDNKANIQRKKITYSQMKSFDTGNKEIFDMFFNNLLNLTKGKIINIDKLDELMNRSVNLTNEFVRKRI